MNGVSQSAQPRNALPENMDAYEMQSSKRMLNVQTLLTATSVPRCYVILLLGGEHLETNMCTANMN